MTTKCQLFINYLTSFYQGFRKDMMKINYQTVNNLKISSELVKFVNEELLKDTNISSEKFWTGFDKYFNELALKNNKFLNISKNLQKKINNWHNKNK